MQMELFSRSKRREQDKSGDDIAIVVPGLVWAVLDGATDPLGGVYDGESSGRLAARTAGQALVQLLQAEGPEVSTARIGEALSGAVAEAAARVGAVHPPSTTLAAAIPMAAGMRLLLIGDSGIRVDGEAIYQNDKLIDDVSAAARIAVRALLAPRTPDADALEALCRQVSFGGLDKAVSEGTLTEGEAASVLAGVEARFAPDLGEHAADIGWFLRGGIRVQPRFANDPDHPFGFASINATLPQGFGITDMVRPKCRSLEIFSDGYYGLPEGTHVWDWEARFEEIEAADPHKIHAFPEVKGSSSAEFSDDRTVLCLHAI